MKNFIMLNGTIRRLGQVSKHTDDIGAVLERQVVEDNLAMANVKLRVPSKEAHRSFYL